MDMSSIKTVNMSNFLIISNNCLGFNIVIMKSNEYINITKVCKHIKKKYILWKKLKRNY
ncbi:putative KilA-N domain-containing protein L4 [BeAn 58058 virus]|uniref:putative KilA-N domain-containing protein L4 n=1 Tax=BeAn 58058 virus TaxID=67082 RepID=UPI00090970D8|nr:putative KilA-N domain-containing protein L4 [BeAn 58058 virus]APG58360.1 putative KilA-N domain-containing protein L4 [BeAn 58058 virus]